jgi:uncharacterized membrane protein
MRESVRKGVSLCVPICVGVFAYAGVFGVLAAAKGVPVSLVALMGVLVFSGSAQFVIVDMWGSASLGTVLGAVASMNLRYLLICASVEPLLAGKPLVQRMLRAHLVADENWAVAMAAQAGESEKADILLAGGIALMLSWRADSCAGTFRPRLRVPRAVCGARRLPLEGEGRSASVDCGRLGDRGRRFHIRRELERARWGAIRRGSAGLEGDAPLMTFAHGLSVILACSVVTFLLRFGGLFLARRLRSDSRIKSVLDAIPSSIMLAFTVHSMRDSGIEGICGIVVTIFVMRRSGSPLAAMASGAASVALLRSFIG